MIDMENLYFRSAANRVSLRLAAQSFVVGALEQDSCLTEVVALHVEGGSRETSLLKTVRWRQPVVGKNLYKLEGFP